MDDLHSRLNDSSRQHPPKPKLRRHAWLWLGICCVVLIAVVVVIMYITSRPRMAMNQPEKETDDTLWEGLTAQQKEAQYTTVAQKLQANPPAASASSEEWTSYYDQLLRVLDADATRIGAYEASKSHDVSLSADVLAGVALAYVNRGASTDKDKALAVLEEARQYIKSNGLDKNESGETTGQLEWVDDRQKAMGL